MRIQHNIMAMNAYRNYNTNTSALAKNLEKLSSGYKINRAGDDAAGLAISEKMRAQITGLQAAQKNVKDGVSLVKTAEGAMQEIQDMLNRMDYLATQSANGTYDDPVDRANLQKEVDALKTEINRIADSANFNGIKLLDGSLAGSSTAASGAGSYVDVTGLGGGMSATKVSGTKAVYTGAAVPAFQDKGGNAISIHNGDTYSVTYNVTDASGNSKDVTIKLTVADADDGTAGKVLKDEYGNTTDLADAGCATATEIGDALVDAIKSNETLKGLFTPTNNAGALTFTGKAAGNVGVNSATVTVNARDAGGVVATTVAMTKTTGGTADAWKVDAANATLWDGKADTLKDSVFTVGGEKFVFIDKDKVDLESDDDDVQAQTVAALDLLKQQGISYVITKAGGTIDADDVSIMAQKINEKTNILALQGDYTTANGFQADNTKTTLIFQNKLSSGSGEGGLRLQIGDTADSFNQMNVKVGDMHASALGIADIDISNQSGAAAAIAKIKDAINSVSSVRGDLGAIQNRLEHTQKNLSVMEENIQDAESTIRDTDVAQEMMAYTKNNILIQSAQAMLAQANAVPQGVLQLLG